MCIWPYNCNLCSPGLNSSSSVSTLCPSLGHFPLFHYFATTNPSNTHSQAKVSLFHGKVLHLFENLCISTISHLWKSTTVFTWFVLIHHSESLWFFVRNSIFSSWFHGICCLICAVEWCSASYMWSASSKDLLQPLSPNVSGRGGAPLGFLRRN